MYQEKQFERSCRRSGKAIALLVSVLLIVTVAVGGTVAFLVAGTDPLQNLFTPSKVTTEVGETLEGSEKRTVFIKNTGDTAAWIRAAVVVTWQDEVGNVYGQTPVAGTDYTIRWVKWTTDGYGWMTGADGFYYWNAPVAAGNSTQLLIESVTVQGAAPDGYSLTVEILGSGIQSKPAQVFDTEWASSGLTVDDSNTDPAQWKLVVKEVQG